MVIESSGRTFQQVVARVLFCLVIVLVLVERAVPALLAGLLAYVLTDKIRRLFEHAACARRVRCELAAGATISVVSVVLMGGIGAAIALLLAGESPAEFAAKLADTLHQAKLYLPPAVAAVMPDSMLAMEELVSKSFRTHAAELATAGSHIAHIVVLMLVGWITGILVALRPPRATGELYPFHHVWLGMWCRIARVFKMVVFAQCKIAFINAVLTGIFLLVVMPLLGWHLPFAKTLTLATFVCGLLPVIGNLISNTLIVVIALSVHFEAAIAALLFLVLIHKLEYFLNAKIQGGALGAQIWELLIALFMMEFLFGPGGMVIAPILYAFVKAELAEFHWIGIRRADELRE